MQTLMNPKTTETKMDSDMISVCPTCGKEVKLSAECVHLMQSMGALKKMVLNCDECAEKVEAQNAERERELYFEGLRRECKIPVSRMDWNSAKGNQQLYYFVLGNKKKSLFISDQYGSGKTWAVCAVGWREKLADIDVLFYVTADLTSELSALYSEYYSAAESLVKELKECDLLILDDFGKERLTDRSGEAIFRVLDARYRDERATWITTNLSLDELAVKMEERGGALKRRIKEEYESWNRYKNA